MSLNYHKRKIIDLGNLSNNSEYNITKLQQYNPIYSRFFDLNENNYNSISLNHKNHIINVNQVIDMNTKEVMNKNIFIKFSPLLDPIRYMIGKYKDTDEKLRGLPKLSSTKDDCHPKLLTHSNASYVDNFFYFLSSTLLNNHNFSHGIDYYGSFLGIQNKFKMNIEDDLEYLVGSKYFLDNIGKIMTLENYDDQNMGSNNTESRKNKDKLIFNKDVILEDTIIIQDDNESISPTEEIVEIYQGTIKNSSSDSDSDSDSDSETSDSGSDSGSGSDSDSGSVSGSDSGSEGEYSLDTIAYINDFPIQMICLEKCQGTLDELFEQGLINENNGASVLFQIIMILLVYQKSFDFTHNDLHTNNIMYISTTKTFLYYKFDDKYYKVPTYGKIFKIIDFGRSIYKYQGKQFCSDSFADGGDGSTQYNCPPFFNEKKPQLDPNYSFDLSRLGCSIYDFIIDDECDLQNLDKLQNVIKRWTMDDNGKSILYKTNGNERYPGFKLYKMISRTVHKHTPQQQLEDPYFNQFIVNNKKAIKTINKTISYFDIDILKSFV
jgi:hypothetical protein